MSEIFKELFDWLSRPPSDYGNHSCDDCTSQARCPLVKFVSDTSVSVGCSCYWPPNADKGPGPGYWEHLDEVARGWLEKADSSDCETEQKAGDDTE